MSTFGFFLGVNGRAPEVICAICRFWTRRSMKKAKITGTIGSFSAKSPFSSCLIPLLVALGWRGNIRGLFESLPHFADSLDLTEFRNTLAHLHYKTEKSSACIAKIDERLLGHPSQDSFKRLT